MSSFDSSLTHTISINSANSDKLQKRELVHSSTTKKLRMSSPSPAAYDPPRGGSSKTAQLQQQVNDVVGIMQQNIDSVRDRGENIDALHHKTTDLEQGAVQFRNSASGIRRQMYWKNMKMRLLIGLGVVILLIIIIVPLATAK